MSINDLCPPIRARVRWGSPMADGRKPSADFIFLVQDHLQKLKSAVGHRLTAIGQSWNQ